MTTLVAETVSDADEVDGEERIIRTFIGDSWAARD